MKKTFSMEVDCANCANKIEAAIGKLPGVVSAGVNFMAGKLILEWQDDVDFTALKKEILKVSRKIEPDCEIEF